MKNTSLIFLVIIALFFVTGCPLVSYNSNHTNYEYRPYYGRYEISGTVTNSKKQPVKDILVYAVLRGDQTNDMLLTNYSDTRVNGHYYLYFDIDNYGQYKYDVSSDDYVYIPYSSDNMYIKIVDIDEKLNGLYENSDVEKVDFNIGTYKYTKDIILKEKE